MSTEIALRGPSPTIEFLAARITRRPNGCWVWQRATSNGYGVFNMADRNYRAHRVAYELFVGPIPQGLHLDHLCRVRACINPAHLEPVTQAENNRRAAAAMTECPQGHTEIDRHPDGRRYCKACKRNYDRARYLARGKR